jgi:hypothetical protein
MREHLRLEARLLRRLVELEGPGSPHLRPDPGLQSPECLHPVPQ